MCANNLRRVFKSETAKSCSNDSNDCQHDTVTTASSHHTQDNYSSTTNRFSQSFSYNKVSVFNSADFQ